MSDRIMSLRLTVRLTVSACMCGEGVMVSIHKNTDFSS